MKWRKKIRRSTGAGQAVDARSRDNGNGRSRKKFRSPPFDFINGPVTFLPLAHRWRSFASVRFHGRAMTRFTDPSVKLPRSGVNCARSFGHAALNTNHSMPAKPQRALLSLSLILLHGV